MPHLTVRQVANGLIIVNGFNEGQLGRMIFSDNLGQTTIIALFDVSLNEEIDDHRFSFSPPANVDVVGQPVSAGPADL